ncbi:MAG: flagellar biosynthesis anti-sigma factor FlgM [Chloroflexi bacterium]|nr:flagellar biosynthesis anti-sigma factor FlgM [Chloroflexota bacterium]
MGIDRISNLPRSTESVHDAGAVRQTQNVQRESTQRVRTELPNPVDTVEISDEARELARARQAVDAAPDVRSEHVAEIKKQVEAGTYSVSPELLARKMLGL